MKELNVVAKHPTENYPFASMTTTTGKQDITYALGVEYNPNEDSVSELQMTAEQFRNIETSDINLNMFIQDVFNGMVEPVENIALVVTHRNLSEGMSSPESMEAEAEAAAIQAQQGI